MSNCYKKIITISPKLATLASGHTFLLIHTRRQTDRQTDAKPANIRVADFIFPCKNERENKQNIVYCASQEMMKL